MSEAFICDFVRTPIGRYEGGLSRVRTDDLAAAAIRHLIARNAAVGEAVDEVFLGCANQAGEDNRNVARMALLLAGLPTHVPGVTLNRLCASGLDAVAAAARALRAGEIELAVAGGGESMTRAPFVMGKAARAFQRTAWIRCLKPARTSPPSATYRARIRTPSRFARNSAPHAPSKPACSRNRSCPWRCPRPRAAPRNRSTATSSFVRRPLWKHSPSSSRWCAPGAPSRRVTHRRSTTAPRRCYWHPERPSRNMGSRRAHACSALHRQGSRRASWAWVRSRRSKSL